MGVIIGTAGHVDHGKTELVKALTGVNTDRLEEEKRRGLTIDLGFAPLDLSKSGRVAIIDVPGHIDYLKNMLAGVAGIDLALLVIAADEGVMPQTLEHLQILKLLRIPKLVLVVNKVDLVDEETREIVAAEVREPLDGTGLQDSPLVQVSARTGEGLDELKETVDGIVASFPPKDLDQPPRLLTDRVFILRGVGTVITGSLVSGCIREGDELVIYPRMKRTRARQVQVFNEKREVAEAGNRVALNLVGVGKEEIRRGDVISGEGAFGPTELLDVELELLPTARGLKDWARVRLYLGAGEFLARAAIMGKKQLQAAEEGLCQLRLEEQVVALFGDRFVLRSYSPMGLLGGGAVVNPRPEKHKRTDRTALAIMRARAEGNLARMVIAELESREVEEELLRRDLNAKKEDWDETILRLKEEGEVHKLAGHLFGKSRWEDLKARVVKEVEEFRFRYPLRPGIPKEELKRRASLEDPLFEAVLSAMKEIEILGRTVRLKGAQVELTPEQLRQSSGLEKLMRKAKFSPPEKKEILEEYDEEIFRSLIEEGTLIKVTEELFFHKDAIEEAKKLVAQYVNDHKEMRLSDMRNVLGSTRKYVVPLAEYLDSIKFTKRSGDLRTLGSR